MTPAATPSPHPTPISILQLEDDPGDVRLVADILRDAGLAADITVAGSHAEFLTALAGGGFDLVLADYRLTGFDGLQALALWHERRPETPFIFVTGSMGEERAIESLKRGATDYILKENLARLVPAVGRALKEAAESARRLAAEEALRGAAERRRILFEQLPDGIIVIDTQTTRFVEFNTAAHQQLGYSREEFAQLTLHDVEAQETEAETLARVAGVIEAGRADFDARHRTREGEIRNVHVTAQLVTVQGRAVYQCVWRDITERKRIKNQLRQLSRAVEQSPVSIVITDLQGQIEYANPKFTRITGYRLDEVRGQNPRFLKSGEMPPEGYARLWQVITSGGEWRGEFHNRKKNGELFWEAASISPLVDGHGQITGFLGVKEDITARKHAEEALRAEIVRKKMDESLLVEAERRRILFEQLPDGIVVIDPQTARFVEFNTAAHQQLGYSREEFARLTVRDVEVKEADAETLARITGANQTGSVDFETLHRTRQGEIRDVHVTSRLVVVQGRAVHQCVFRDITERKLVEIQLSQMAERKMLAARAGGVGIWDYDVVNNRLVWDDQMFALYGITPDQFSGAYEAWQAGLHPEDRQRGDQEVRMALQGEKDFDMEFRVLWPDGTIRTLRSIATVRRDAAGQPTQIIGTNWDITVQKQAAEQLQQTNEALTTKDRALEVEVEVRRTAEQRVHVLNDQLALRVTELGAVNAELESFSYTVSHDLRAPLRQVVGFAHTLQKTAGDRLDPRAAEYIPLIQGSATRMGQLIDDMIEFSGLGRTAVHFGPVKLQSLVEQARQVLEPATDGRIVRWQIGPLPEVQGDAVMLGLVLMNLLDNALKFTRPRAEAEIAVGCESTPHECIVSVADNGVGFDDRHAEQLFGVFQRLHGRDEFEGTGIGLASVRRIIQRHGGRTWAASRLGQGTTVFFALPANPTAPAARSVLPP